MKCRLEYRDGSEKVVEGLTTIHGMEMNAAVYKDGKYMIRHPDMPGGKNMTCTVFGDELMQCQKW